MKLKVPSSASITVEGGRWGVSLCCLLLGVLCAGKSVSEVAQVS